jgi:hypothetical protein
MITTFADAMMPAQADRVCGAGYGERGEARTNRRNGYRAREWDAGRHGRAGDPQAARGLLLPGPAGFGAQHGDVGQAIPAQREG